jgi:putative membrane protein
MELLRLIGIGIILGIANVIPGVSGGTIAVTFNVYDRLIAVITPDIRKILGAWKFWLPLGIGIGVGIVFFSNVIGFLFLRYPIPTNWFFIGIILGSIPMLYRKIRVSGSERLPISGILCAVAAVCLMAVMKILKISDETQIYTEVTLVIVALLFVSGALAAIAMIIPGISGSFLLLATGMYPTIIHAVADLNVLLLVPTAVGIGIGLLSGAALVRVLMAKIPVQTYGAILGLV